MRIAYATYFDARDLNRGSGSTYYFCRALERAGHSVAYVGPIDVNFGFGARLSRALHRAVGYRYRSYADVLATRAVATALQARLHSVDHDVYLTNDYMLAGVADTRCPVVLYTDAAFPRRYGANAHPWLAGLSPYSVWSEQRVVARALGRVTNAAFASSYAAQEARGYGISADKVHVIPYGANLSSPPGPEVAASRSVSAIAHKGCVDLLFVGKHWELKGGAIAVEVVRQLNDTGTPARLHVVGCEPPGVVGASGVTAYGYLDKSCEPALQQLETLYMSCDFLLLPTLAEGFGTVFAEAAAFGLPSLSYQTTGVCTAVRNGETGILLPPGAGAGRFADVVSGILREPVRYRCLVEGARLHYEGEARWEVASMRLLEVMSQHVALPA